MVLGDREFTSEEVAAMCGVTRVTVADWITRGRLAVRWTAGGHRRIPRDSLAFFMRAQGYAVPRTVDSSRALTLVMDSRPERLAQIAAAFEAPEEFDVECIVTGIEALLTIGARGPDVLVFSTRMPGFDTHQFVEAIRRDPRRSDCALVAVMTLEEESSALRRLGVDITTTLERLGDVRANVVRWLTERQRRVSLDEMPDADRSGPRARRAASSLPPSRVVDPAAGK